MALVLVGPALVDGGALVLGRVVAVVLGVLAVVGLPLLVSVAAGADCTRPARA